MYDTYCDPLAPKVSIYPEDLLSLDNPSNPISWNSPWNPLSNVSILTLFK